MTAIGNAIGEQVKASDKARDLHEQDLRRQQVRAHDRCNTCNLTRTSSHAAVIRKQLCTCLWFLFNQ